MMRAIALLALAGCTAQAAPPFSGGGSAPQSGGDMIGTSSTLAQCQAMTPAEGDLCFPTDSPYTMVARSAGTWSYRYPGIGFDVTLPPSGGWTAYNSGSVAASGGSRVLTMPAETTAGGWRGERRTMPATPYYVEMVLDAAYTGTSALTGAYGGMFTDGAGFAGALFGGAKTPQVIRQTDATTFAGTDADVDGWPRNPIAIKLADDGTLRHFYVGDGLGGWSEVGAGFGRTVTITATDIGWTAIGQDAEATRKIALVHWKTGTP